jgi:hypothetical protein
VLQPAGFFPTTPSYNLTVLTLDRRGAKSLLCHLKIAFVASNALSDLGCPIASDIGQALRGSEGIPPKKIFSYYGV